MKIKRVENSRIDQIDFTDLPFGRVFSDHMLICEFKNGNWQSPEILPYGPIPMLPSSQVLHYGQSIFEGMKAFKEKRNPIFRGK